MIAIITLLRSRQYGGIHFPAVSEKCRDLSRTVPTRRPKLVMKESSFIFQRINDNYMKLKDENILATLFSLLILFVSSVNH